MYHWLNIPIFIMIYRSYKPQSGASSDDKKKWKYFDLMMFLYKISKPKNTISNIPNPLESPISDIDTPSRSRKNKKKVVIFSNVHNLNKFLFPIYKINSSLRNKKKWHDVSINSLQKKPTNYFWIY